MTTPAVTIQDAINFCSDNIGQLSYDAVHAIQPRMTTWITTLFSKGGIFANVDSDPQRTVIDWYIANNNALDQCEGSTPGSTGVFSTSAVIEAVTRTLCAVQVAKNNGYITSAQQTAVIAAFNINWT